MNNAPLSPFMTDARQLSGTRGAGLHEHTRPGAVLRAYFVRETSHAGLAGAARWRRRPRDHGAGRDPDRPLRTRGHRTSRATPRHWSVARLARIVRQEAPWR